jgi:signal transduction histidine kinase
VVTDIGAVTDQRIPAELYRDIKLCLYEIMNNTIRHAKGNRFKFEFRATDGMLYIATCDNGILDDIRNIEDKGNGVRNLVKRVKRHNGKISFSIPEKETGLCVKMNLPLT